MHDLKPDLRDSRGIISFKAKPEEIEKGDALAAAEGLTRASFARRAYLIDVKRRGASQTGEAA